MEINPYNSAEALGLQMLTEDQIERLVERRMDGFDRNLIAGHMSQIAYDTKVTDLNDWAETMYRKVAR